MGLRMDEEKGGEVVGGKMEGRRVRVGEVTKR